MAIPLGQGSKYQGCSDWSRFDGGDGRRQRQSAQQRICAALEQGRGCTTLLSPEAPCRSSLHTQCLPLSDFARHSLPAMDTRGERLPLESRPPIHPISGRACCPSSGSPSLPSSALLLLLHDAHLLPPCVLQQRGPGSLDPAIESPSWLYHLPAVGHEKEGTGSVGMVLGPGMADLCRAQLLSHGDGGGSKLRGREIGREITMARGKREKSVEKRSFFRGEGRV